MDFFASQELARRNTRRLVAMLVVTLICLIVSIYLLIIAVGQVVERKGGGHFFSDGWLNLPVLGIVALTVSTVVGVGSLMKIIELKGGGSKVAQQLGGRRILPGSAEPSERKVLNVVEEMALASGIPVPPVYVLDQETTINAFAAGHSIDDAAIGVNRGTIELLTRDELQGVIAHEFSHILNGDMRMSLRMIGLLHGVQAIALIGWAILRVIGNSSRGSSSNSKKEGGGILLVAAIGVGLLILGSLGLFFARLIKASISRQREYLADSSAVQFTRNPETIGNALKMIGAVSGHSRMVNPNAEAISHMFFGNMSGTLLSGLLSTHPPLVPRIQKIESRFDGNFDAWFQERERRGGRLESARDGKPVEKRGSAAKTAIGMLERMGRAGEMLEQNLPLDPALLVASIGSPTDDDVLFSRVLVGKVPDQLLNALRDTFQARCVAFAYLLEPAASNEALRASQNEHIAAKHGVGTLQQTLALEPLIRNADVRWRLAMFEIVQGTLVGLSLPQYDIFKQSVIWLTESDGRVSLFEFFLQHHLLTHLDRHFGIRPMDKIRFERAEQVAGEINLLLDMMVKNGDRAESSRQRAFAAALEQLPSEVQPLLAMRATNPRVSELNSALERLKVSAPAVRKEFLSAAATAISVDQQISVAEAELFRALGEALDCPVPPLLANHSETAAE